VHIALLGGLAVIAGDPSVTVEGARLGGRRAHLVLSALALEPGPLSAERLASLIWEEPPPTWRVAVRGLVGDLRKRLAGLDSDVVVTTPNGYRLAAGVGSDVADLEAALVSAAGLRGAGRWQALLARLGDAPTLDPGQLAAGLEADWLKPHRDRLDETVLQAALLAAAAHSELGDHDAAVALARRLTAAHPLDERAHRALIRALDRAENRSAAVRAFEVCRATLSDELGVDPSTETLTAYLQVLRGQPSIGPGRVPAPATSFVGRDSELQHLAAACAVPGLVTVTGPGGVGKSRLTQEVAARTIDLVGGRRWVSLAAVAEDALVDASVAMALGLQPGGDDPGRALAGHLTPLGRTLLVMDGCEAVRDGVATLASLLVAEAPELTVVVTSRLPLGLDEEVLVVVPPLRMPAGASVAELSDNAQVRLLVERVAEQGGSLVVDDSLAEYVAALCRRCAGLPLALELVAAQLPAMSPADLVEHLDEVSAGTSDALRGIAEASLALLDPEEAIAFRRMSVLEGQVDLATVRAVAGGPDLPRVRVVRILRELVARGMVGVDRSGPRWTYEQDDDLHRFARGQLVEAGEEADVLARLLDLFGSLLPDDPRSPPGPFVDAVTDLLPSLRGLLGAGVNDKADGTRCLELAFRLHRYWAATNVGEGCYWLARLIERQGREGDDWTAYATYALGYLNYWAGDDLAAVPRLERAITLLERVDGAYVARAQIFLAGILDDLDRGAEAVDLVRAAIASAEPHGRDLQVSAAMGLGSVLAERADPEAAEHAAAAIALCEAGGSSEQLAASLPTAAMIAWQVGALDLVRRWVDVALPMHAGVRRIAHVVLLSVSCGLHLAEGDLDAAVELGRSADLEGTELGVERELPLARSLLALALLARGDGVEAADRAGAAVQAAGALGYDFPLATALETTALVASTLGRDAERLAPILATAAAIRTAGDRPVPVPLAAQVSTLREHLPAAEPMTPDHAAAAALALVVKDPDA
jgi:DNA-binding SARP family transcriptional activator/predicted ATPase